MNKGKTKLIDHLVNERYQKQVEIVDKIYPELMELSGILWSSPGSALNINVNGGMFVYIPDNNPNYISRENHISQIKELLKKVEEMVKDEKIYHAFSRCESIRMGNEGKQIRNELRAELRQQLKSLEKELLSP